MNLSWCLTSRYPWGTRTPENYSWISGQFERSRTRGVADDMFYSLLAVDRSSIHSDTLASPCTWTKYHAENVICEGEERGANYTCLKIGKIDSMVCGSSTRKNVICQGQEREADNTYLKIDKVDSVRVDRQPEKRHLSRPRAGSCLYSSKDR
ncbi:hypothetical protein RRG08_056079 [Elysia crispata]|uniref:Uncharacterized protein n=1 Tax=Elysia crispata TaxID=231223 RepID=A0AAE0ZC22_9GAST|nr:hypothetical protein RRG08_056079 [Elysia crispata]